MRPTLKSLRALSWSAVLAFSLAGCGGDGGNEPNDSGLTGSWSGDFQGEGGMAATLSLHLSETAGAVTGNGSLAVDSESLPLTVSGTHDSPNVTLTLDSPGFEATTLSAELNADRLTGQLNGSGFENVDVVLEKH